MERDEQRGLADAARGGDPDAWERLYRHAYPRLFAYAASRAGTDAAEDLVHEAMARAVASIDRFEWDGGGFDAWLFGILRRTCLEHYRRLRRRRALPAGEWIDRADPGEHLEHAAEKEAVRRAFAGLDPAERDILSLRLIAGLSAEEVAGIVGKSAGAVRTAQSRALASLRTRMRQYQ